MWWFNFVFFDATSSIDTPVETPAYLIENYGIFPLNTRSQRII